MIKQSRTAAERQTAKNRVNIKPFRLGRSNAIVRARQRQDQSENAIIYSIDRSTDRRNQRTARR